VTSDKAQEWVKEIFDARRTIMRMYPNFAALELDQEETYEEQMQ